MTDSNWAIPGAGVYLSKPTAAQAAAAVEARRRGATGTAEEMRTQREQEMAVLRARHAWMLERTQSPILRDLIEEHGPRGDGLWPTCTGCPPVSNGYDTDPEDWPCGPWSFVSDRMEGP